MKKYLFILIIALIFIVQHLFSEEILFFTLHEQGHRKMIANLENHLIVMPGEPDEYLSARRKAIFSIRVIEDRECYVIFLHNEEENQDYIHLYDADSKALLSAQPLYPYWVDQKSRNLFCRVVDLNGDGNLEIAVVADSRAGKKLRIYKVFHLSLVEVPLNMAENYAQIIPEDLNRDGKIEIMAQTRKNGILQVPELFHYHQHQWKKLPLSHFPTAIKRYEEYLKSMEDRFSVYSGVRDIQPLDLELSRLKFLLTLEQYEEFNQLLLSLRTDLAWNLDHPYRLRLYRTRIYQAWQTMEEQRDEQEAMSIIQSAIIELHAMTAQRTESEIKSLVYVEMAGYYRWKNELDQAKNWLMEALELNPWNGIAKDMVESYFLENVTH